MTRNIAFTAMAMTALILVAPSAFAATQAGTKVHNSASVSYKVGGVDQTAPEPGSADFLVDRKVDIIVTESGGAATTATPGANSGPSVVTKFQVVNNTNDLLDIKLDVAGQASGTVFDAGTAGDGADTIPSTVDDNMSFKLYADTNTNGSYDDGTDQELPKDGGQYYIDGMAGDGATAVVFAIADQLPSIGTDPGDVADGDILAVMLTGTAASAYANPDGTGLTWNGSATWNGDGTPDWTADAGNLGADLADTASDTASKVDNVLAESEDTDFSPSTGTDHDGTDAAIDAYEIGAASITVTKQSAVYWDPINHFTSPKAIPGSVVLYCITVKNEGSATASDIAVNDLVPTNTTFEEGDLTTGVDTDPDTGGVQPLTDGTTTLSAANSLRFSTSDTCAASTWDAAGVAGGAMVEDSDSSGPADSGDTDTDGIPNDDEGDTADGHYGDYDSGTIKTIVTSLGSGTPTPQYTTAMFLVKVN